MLGLTPSAVERVQHQTLAKLRDSGLLPPEAFAGPPPYRSHAWEAIADALAVLVPRSKTGPKRQEETHG